MSSLDAFSSANHEPGTSQSHAEQSNSRPTGLKLVLPPLKAGKPIKVSKRTSAANRAGFMQELEAKKAQKPVKLKPLKEVLTRLITQIKKKDDYAFFLTPVDASSFPGYSDAVKRPMDFGTMTTKVSKGKYRSLEEFASDFRLVTTNAKTFNPPGTIYHTEADRIELFGLDHISKAAATVIEYETDWNIEIEQDDENNALNVDDYDGDASIPMEVDGSLAAASPAPSGSQPPPGKKGTRGPYKKAATVTNIGENIDAEGRLPGSKDGLAAFPPGSDWAKLMLALKLKGKRYRTKKERLRMEKGGPPYCADGSLDYSEMEDPFSILSIFAPEPPSRPQLIPLYPSPLPSNPINPSFPAPTNIPTPSYPPSPGPVLPVPLKRRHWIVTRNGFSRANRTKEKEDEDLTLTTWHCPREVHAVDFDPYPGLVGRLAEDMGISDIGAQLGTEETLFDAIRESIQCEGDEAMDASGDEYWTRKRATAAQNYICDVVYGGVDGLAYVRSLAEFVAPPAALVKTGPIGSSTTGLGIPVAQYVVDNIVDPITEGLHNVLCSTAQHLAAPASSPPPPTHIISQIDLSLHQYPQLSHSLNELKKVTSESIDMAALIRLPAELFLSENEWAGARWKEEAAKRAEEEKARSMGLWGVDGRGASEYLAFAIKSHQEAQAQGINDGSNGYINEEPEMLQYVMDHAAKAIIALDARREAGDLKLRSPSDDMGRAEDTTQAVEDAGLRELRLNLLALAKRAPLDKIRRLPVELVPEHIRHVVPTL